MSVPLLIAVTGAREAPLVAGLEQVAEDVRVVRRCADLAELLSAAQAGLGRAAVLSGDLHRLDREAVVALRQAGVAAVGLSDPDDAAAAARLRDLGLSVVLPTDAPASDVALAVLDAVRELAAQDARAAEDARAAAEVVPPTGPAGGRVRGRRATYAAPLAQSPAHSAIRAGDKPIADPADALSAAPGAVRTPSGCAPRPGSGRGS